MAFVKKEKKRALWTQAFPTQYANLQAGASHKKNLRLGAKNCTRSKSFAKSQKPVKRKSPMNYHPIAWVYKSFTKSEFQNLVKKYGDPNDECPFPIKSKKRIRRMSSKKSKLDRIYNVRVKVWIKDKMCHYCSKMASETHHYRGRLGSLLMDERFWIPLCSEHHRWVHDNPKEAREKGLLAPAGEFNSIPK